MSATTILLLAQAASSLFMTGLIWFIQVVHYPLFGRVGADGYADYQSEHMRRTTLVVGPPMAVEMISAIGLIALRPASVPGWWTWAGAAMVALLWLSTALVQAPAHGKLVDGWDPRLGRRLVDSNWFRTILWTLRGALALAMLARVIPS